MDTDRHPHSQDTPLRALPVVILPGINNTAATWAPVVDALRAAGMQAQAHDLPAVTSTSGIVSALAPMLPDRFTLVGHSFGGYVALEFLAARPERVAAICLVNSLDSADTAVGQEGRRKSVDAVRAGGYRDLAAGATAKAYHRDNLGDAALMAARERDVEQYGPERFIAHQTAAAKRATRRDNFRAAPQPKLVLAATEDTVIPTSAQQAMAEATGAAYAEIGLAGHMLPAEQPTELAAALGRWISQSTHRASTNT
ncbi:UNVERIFIED_ORG: pimeloyl-ACP methyl ester carboxylesterase [Rhodococcus erythropolis]